MNDIKVDLFFLVAHRYFLWKTGHLKTWGPFFALHLILGEKLESCLFALILYGIRNNKLLNLEVRDLKQVENHWPRIWLQIVQKSIFLPCLAQFCQTDSSNKKKRSWLTDLCDGKCGWEQIRKGAFGAINPL